jgi:RimJ/RimL family protein N-acetyltransferase
VSATSSASLHPCPAEIRTERLILRRWREADLESYAALQSDPRVRRFFERPLTIGEAFEDGRRHAEGFDRNGFDLWVLERPGEAAFLGVTGVRRIGRAMPFSPLVDVGWLLLPAFWGRGFAAEAARAALHDAFTRTGLDEVVAYTSRLNEPSRKVMRRLGMVRNPADDFDHPAQSETSLVRRQVLYRLTREAFFRRGIARRPRP